MSAVTAVGAMATPDTAVVDDAELEDTVLEGALVDPELLRTIQRVAHREYLLGREQTQTYRHPLTRPVRRRPSTVRSLRTVRGTTARKVTWSR